MREFVSARLGDARLRLRLAKLVAAFTGYPNGSLPQTFTDWGSLKAAYRFFSNRRVQARSIFAAHAASTMETLKGHPIVLAAQDTTYFNFTSRPRTSDNGEPLGLMGAVLWSRAEPALAARDKKARSARTPQEKESARWMKTLHHITQGVPAGTEVVAGSDRRVSASRRDRRSQGVGARNPRPQTGGRGGAETLAGRGGRRRPRCGQRHRPPSR